MLLRFVFVLSVLDGGKKADTSFVGVWIDGIESDDSLLSYQCPETRFYRSYLTDDEREDLRS